MQRWKCWDLGDVMEFFHIRIIKEGSTVNIDQYAYLDTALEQCRMQDKKSATTPLLARYMPEAVAQDATIDPEL